MDGISICENEERPRHEIKEENAALLIKKNNHKFGQGLIAPEGGWGWFVVLGSFIIHVLFPFVAALFGLLYPHLVSELDLSSLTIAWIYNLQSFLWNLVGLIVGPLCVQFGWRTIALFGSICSSLAVIITGYATSAAFIFLSFSVLNGIGGGLAFSICHLSLPFYFKKRRGLAIAVAMSGVSVGQFILPLLIRHLQMDFGFNGAVLIFGGIMMHSIVAAALFHPIEWHAKPSHNDMDEAQCRLSPIKSKEDCDLTPVERQQPQHESFKSTLEKDDSEKSPKFVNSVIRNILYEIWHLSVSNIKLLKTPKVIIVAVSSGSFVSGFLNFTLMLPFSLVNKALTLQEATYCISLVGISSLIGRISVPILSDLTKRQYMVCIYQIIGQLLIAISIFIFTFLSEFIWIAVCLSVFGFGSGITMGLYTLVMIEIVGLENLSSTFGATSFVVAFLFISVGPTAGWLRDFTGDYNICNQFLGMVVLFGASLWIVMPFIISKEKLKFSPAVPEDSKD